MVEVNPPQAPFILNNSVILYVFIDVCHILHRLQKALHKLEGRSYSLKNLDRPKFSSRFFDVNIMINSVLVNIPGGPHINCYHKPRIYTFIFLSLSSIFTEK